MVADRPFAVSDWREREPPSYVSCLDRSHNGDGRRCYTAPLMSSNLARVSVEVNGTRYEREVEPRLLLSDFLRHDLGLTGTHVGCEHGVCGACTVLLDGEAVRSCLLFAVQTTGRSLQTIEGLAVRAPSDAAAIALHPLQAAFREAHALQCGFCTPGFITTAHALLTEEPDCDADRVREVLSGNICRCTGYISIVEAVLDARAAYKKDGAR